MKTILDFVKDLLEAHLRLIALWVLTIFFISTFPAWFLIWCISGFQKEYWKWVFTLEFLERT